MMNKTLVWTCFLISSCAWNEPVDPTQTTDAIQSALTAVSAVPVFSPWAALLSPLIVPLFGKRGRKHYGTAVQMLNPLHKKEGRLVAPAQAAAAVAKALGLMHSNEASKKAAE